MEFDLPIAAISQKARPGLSPQADGYVVPIDLVLIMVMTFARPTQVTVWSCLGTSLEVQMKQSLTVTPFDTKILNPAMFDKVGPTLKK